MYYIYFVPYVCSYFVLCMPTLRKKSVLVTRIKKCQSSLVGLNPTQIFSHSAIYLYLFKSKPEFLAAK